jgi:deoxyribose-phosphate aldolase
VAKLPAWLARLPGEPRLGDIVEDTLLRPDAGRDDVLRLCTEARELGCRAACVAGQWLPAAREALSGSAVLLVAVADFPMGRGSTRERVREVERLGAAGADEIDIVAPLAGLAAGDWAAVERDLRSVVAATPRPVKVILETAALEPAAIAAASGIVRDVGAFAVKTSTGYHAAGGATVEAVSLMRGSVGLALRVKASGGIRTVAQALALLRAGADLVGTSAAGSWGDALGPAAPPLAQLLADSV